MASDSARILNVLLREYMFQGLDQAQLNYIASRFKRLTLSKDTVVFSEGDPPDSFYIVLDGRVQATRRQHGEDRLIYYLGPGDFFGEMALIYNRPRSDTITTVDRTTLLRLDGDQLNALLQEFPQIRLNLSATARSRRLAHQFKFRWMAPDEVIYYVTRKHWLFLMQALILPIVLIVTGLGLLMYIFLQAGLSAVSGGTFWFGLVLLLGGAAWAVWSFYDWGNDYYIVTNRRVLWREKLVGLYESRREAPLDTVLAVNVSTSQLGRILDYGNITVRTYTGGIPMNHAAKPYEFASFVEGYKIRAGQMSKEQELKEMERTVDRAVDPDILQNGMVLRPVQPPPPVKAPPRMRKKSELREKWETFLRVRYEEGGVITYRKHWFILLRKTWLPLLMQLLITIGTFGAILEGFSGPWLFLAFFLFSILFFLWGGYHYWDWSNDIYRLTPDQIFDIERRPLGREEKKTANLENILSIEHESPNLLSNILNFGNVVVNVGTTQFTFDGVYNPGEVHADIADYQEALKRRKREAERKREHDRMEDWLRTYHLRTRRLEDLENPSEGEDFSG